MISRPLTILAACLFTRARTCTLSHTHNLVNKRSHTLHLMKFTNVYVVSGSQKLTCKISSGSQQCCHCCFIFRLRPAQFKQHLGEKPHWRYQRQPKIAISLVDPLSLSLTACSLLCLTSYFFPFRNKLCASLSETEKGVHHLILPPFHRSRWDHSQHVPYFLFYLKGHIQEGSRKQAPF